jgi:hypothetical protein
MKTWAKSGRAILALAKRLGIEGPLAEKTGDQIFFPAPGRKPLLV